jgi:hypothetical protein
VTQPTCRHETKACSPTSGCPNCCAYWQLVDGPVNCREAEIVEDEAEARGWLLRVKAARPGEAPGLYTVLSTGELQALGGEFPIPVELQRVLVAGLARVKRQTRRRSAKGVR